MDKSKHNNFPFRVTNVIEATSFFVGYVIVTILMANSVFYETKHTYILIMLIGFVFICLAKIWLHKGK